VTTNVQQPDPPPSRSTAELLKDLSEQISHLVRKEIQLASAEMETKRRRFGFGAGLFGLAGMLALYAGGALVAAAVLLLALAMPAWAAALIVALVIAAVAAVMALVARDHVRRATPPTPQEAVGSIRQDIEAVREGARR
jgi:Flp pilus assembly protein TadB